MFPIFHFIEFHLNTLVDFVSFLVPLLFNQFDFYQLELIHINNIVTV